MQRIAARLLHIFLQGVAIQRDHQRQRVGVNEFNAVFIVNVLFPEGRQMHFNGIEVVAPLIRIVGGDTVAGDRVGQNNDAIAFSIQRQGNRAALAPVGPGTCWIWLRLSR